MMTDGNCAVLILLDLSAAFDSLDHGILLNRLQQIGIQGCVLSWFVSYLKGRTFSVETGKYSSSCAPVLYGVPQGSILGPVLFSLYMLPLYAIFKKHNVSYHCYADDTQCYVPLHPKDGSSLQCLFDCLRDVKQWMSANFLQLNESNCAFTPDATCANKSRYLRVVGRLNILSLLASFAREIRFIRA